MRRRTLEPMKVGRSLMLALTALLLVGHDVAGAATPRLQNLSTRARVETGDNVMIGGFIISGAGPKTVLVRAVGPSLASLGVPGALANPVLRLFSGQTAIAENDDWSVSLPLCASSGHTCGGAAAISGTGLAPVNALEAAILISLAPGAYTAIVTGAGGGTGVGLVEVFEVADSLAAAQGAVCLANLSTRARVETGDNVMIGGFIISGAGPKTVLVRAVGPSLASLGVPGALANPVLRLFSGQTAIAENDDWSVSLPLCASSGHTCGGAAAISGTGLAPVNALEAAILISLAPGAYTAIVTGAGGGTGVGLVEVFEVAGSGPFQLASLSQSSGVPGDTLVLTGSGFEPCAQTFARFFDGAGFDVKIPVTPVEDSIKVAVPPYFNVNTNQLGPSPAPMSVQVLQERGGATVATNALAGFRIDAMPATGVATGALTLQWLDRMVGETDEAIRRLDALALLFPQATSTAALRDRLTRVRTSLLGLRSQVAAVSSGQSSPAAFGRVNGHDVPLDPGTIALIDQLVRAQLRGFAQGPAAATERAPETCSPYRFKSGVPRAVTEASVRTEADDFAEFDELFANIREGVRENRELMSRFGGAMMAVGGLIALTPGGQGIGLGLTALGAMTWFVGVHANTGILLALDVGTAETLGGADAYGNALQDMREYLTDVFANGAGFLAGTLDDTLGTLLDLTTVGSELDGAARTYFENTQSDFEAGRIPEDGATGLPPQQSCCVIHGGCPGETGSRCAPNCCCCGAGEACDRSNTTLGCISVGF